MADQLQTHWHFIWAEINRLVEKIEDNECKPEMVVGISRGGLIPAAMIARQLHLPLVSIEIGEGVEQFGQHGTCLLIVDDIYDSGETIREIFQSGGRQHIYCCLYNKNQAGDTGLPDYAIDINTEKWVVFPWESEDDV